MAEDISTRGKSPALTSNTCMLYIRFAYWSEKNEDIEGKALNLDAN